MTLIGDSIPFNIILFITYRCRFIPQQDFAYFLSGLPNSKILFEFCSPENAFMTTKARESDVYSYGVLLLELITRKRALDPSFAEDTNIVGWVRSAWNRTGDVRSFVDSGLADEFFDSAIMEQVTGVLSIALRCVEPDPGKRPGMREVVNQLLDVNAQPEYEQAGLMLKISSSPTHSSSNSSL